MKEIKATMAGSVWKITVKEGDNVDIDQDVIILESMKMEIPIVSEGGGVVKELKVAEGDFVNEGDTLVLLEG